MREILFRGKTAEPSDKRKWIYEAVILPKEGLSACITNGNIATCRLDDIAYFVHTQVLLETVGQFTGLTEKNGKKIFEGDIISYEDEAPGQYEYHDSIIANFGVIEFGDGGFYFTNSIAATMNDLLLGNDVLDCEVIGNIHDNPEMLK